MIDSFGTIPSHPLLVHVPVVLVPMSLLATVLMLAFPSLRRRFSTVAIAILTLAFIGSVLAAQSGRSLENRYTAAGQTIPELLEDHADMGTQLQYFVGIYLILSIAWLVRARRSGPTTRDDGTISRRPQIVSAVLVVMVLAAGVFSTASTLRTGHSGARSVWEQVSFD